MNTTESQLKSTVFEAKKELKLSLKPFLQELGKFQKRFEEIDYQVSSSMRAYKRRIENFGRTIEPILRAIAPILEELHRSYKEFPENTRKALLMLAEHGWYMDFNMEFSIPSELQEIISNGDIDSYLEEYFEAQLEEIEKSITEQFPHRTHIISSAIKAHINGDYCLSIPVLLAQTDGICKEVCGQELFMKRRGDWKPKIAIYVEQNITDTFMTALLTPLTESTPIVASHSERETGFNQLNRHMVLHGESLDYGNKVNSLKAISLINYVSQALKQIDEHLELN